MMKMDFATYNDDGSVEIFGNDSGTPYIKAVVPAPDVNTSSEEERQKRFDRALAGITLKGYFLISQRRIKNQAFDKKGQKTTLSIEFRPCKNKDEIKAVHNQILAILLKEKGFIQSRDLTEEELKPGRGEQQDG